MLVQRRRWQDNIDLALGERLVFVSAGRWTNVVRAMVQCLVFAGND